MPPFPWTALQTHDGYEVSRQGGTIRLCLNRPEQGNALTLSMMQDITLLFKALSTDASVHRIIITGCGRYFCTGMQLKEDLFGSVSQRRTALQDLFSVIDTCPKTTIAVINGPAFGGGVGLATVCDVRLALSTSFFCLSEVKLGLCPAIISRFIVREWGTSLARMAMMTGRRVESQTLYGAGVLHALAPDIDSLEKITEEFLSAMRLAAPQASALCKMLVRETAWDGDTETTVGEVFAAMLAENSESSYGVAQFRKGTKAILWEDRDGNGCI
ncbi:enoyl-CoA hydratase/isomerase family protein [Pseudomassariella vexata]|uniref:Enoyl-CoA hydratase/isomerase family protein n=1 Tax=Pseudomassariella vexata TaxID=1141098 RepID=A0A1Y2E7K7_9PEZI|nr:enoyl-CoA hydratase/isomerase family protein [Pseudomassariella vexata]ORY67548.1 enoyl-CoA hydratase/isomerase family protein [Pseudomassariella vexata]